MLIDFEDRYNIFTDASTTGVTEDSICYATASKFYVIKGRDVDHPVSSDTAVLTFSTSPFAELFAIFMGVKEAAKIASVVPGAKFNLFSDNIMGVNAVRRFSKGKSDAEIRSALVQNNWDKFQYNKLKQQIVKVINDNNLDIKLYHQSGHLNTNGFDGIFACLSKFPVNNDGATIDYDIATVLCICNNVVDKGSRFKLKQYVEQEVKIPPVWVDNSNNSPLITVAKA